MLLRAQEASTDRSALGERGSKRQKPLRFLRPEVLAVRGGEAGLLAFVLDPRLLGWLGRRTEL
jgi:hypothetical protein